MTVASNGKRTESSSFFDLITGHRDAREGERGRFKEDEDFQRALDAACKRFGVGNIEADMADCESMSQYQLTVVMGVLGIKKPEERGDLVKALEDEEDEDFERDPKPRPKDHSVILTYDEVKKFADGEPGVDPSALTHAERIEKMLAERTAKGISHPSPPEKLEPRTFRAHSARPQKRLTARDLLLAGVPEGNDISKLLGYMEEKREQIGHPAGFLLTLLIGKNKKAGIVLLSPGELAEKMKEHGYDVPDKRVAKWCGWGEKGCNIKERLPQGEKSGDTKKAEAKADGKKDKAEAIMEIVEAEAKAMGITLKMPKKDRAKCIAVLNTRSNEGMWEAATAAQEAVEAALYKA